MRRRKSFIFLITLLSLMMTAKSPADVQDQLEQAKTFINDGQYQQAEDMYLQIQAKNPGSDAALEAQKNLILIYIVTDKQTQASTSFGQLISEFSLHKDIAGAIWQIAREFNKAGNKARATELHQYNASNYSNDKYAMWSQVEIVKSYISDGNDTADEATDELINKFSEQPTLPKEIYQIALRFSQAGKKEQAAKLDKFNAENFISNPYGMWSQVNNLIRNSDYTTADATVDKILTDFPDDPASRQGVYQLTDVFRKARRYDKALALYKYHIEHWPNVEEGLEARKGLIQTYIDLNDEKNAQVATDKLLADFSTHDRIARTVYELGRHYTLSNKPDKALKLYQHSTENFSKDDKYTMWSQMEIIKSHILDNNEPSAGAAYQELLKEFSHQPTLPTEICRVADTYLAAGNLDKASQLYQYTRNTWPGDNQLLWADAGMVKLDIVNKDDTKVRQAIDSLFSNSKNHPELPKAMFQIGEQYWDLALYKRRNGIKDKVPEDFTKALAIWKRIIKESPHDSSASHAYHFSAQCYYHLGQYEKAAEYLRKVLDNWPDYEYGWSTHNFLGACYERFIESGSMTESEAEIKIEQAYKAIVEDYPDCPMMGHACLKLAQLASRKKRWREAVEYYSTFINNYPDDIRCKYILYDLGRAYERVGELENAAQIYQLVIQQDNAGDGRVQNSMIRLARIKGEER